MFDGVLKHRAGPAETVAGIEQAIDLRSVPRPLLDLVEIVQVGDQRIGGFLTDPPLLQDECTTRKPCVG